jgi:uncharacterized protein YcfJ
LFRFANFFEYKSMKTLRSALVASISLLTLPITLVAQNYGGGYDYARVVSAQPIYETVEIDDGREVCRNERVHHAAPNYGRGYRGERRETPSIVGAIIGGVIGNQFGSGRGRTAATVAGVALGSAIARDNERDRAYGYNDNRRYSRSVVTTERVCTIEPRIRTERQLVGYNVRYDYKGQIGETVTRNQPGSTIRVRVDVEAIED